MNIYANTDIVGGMWIHVEVLNIPWSNDLLDPTSHAFMMAKAIIETDVSLIIQILISYKLEKQRNDFLATIVDIVISFDQA